MKSTALAIYPFLIAIGSLAAADVELEKTANYGGFNSFAFSPDGQTVAGGTGIATITIGAAKSKHGGEVVLWDAKAGKLLKTFGKHAENPDWVAFDESGALLASASPANGMVKLWDVKSGAALRTIDVGGKIADGNNGLDDRVDMTADGNGVHGAKHRRKDRRTHRRARRRTDGLGREDRRQAVDGARYCAAIVHCCR